MKIIELTPDFAASEQVGTGDMQAIYDAGYRVVVNNRPDGEVPGQPDSESLRAAAEAAGLNYRFLPVTAMNFPGAPAAEVAEVFDSAAGPVLAFCRSGTRSTNLWVVSRSAAERADAIARARGLGYDLSMAERFGASQR